MASNIESNFDGTTKLARKKADPKEACGIIMPISGMGECTESHSTDVLSIISEACETAGFGTNLVSDADEVTVIQKTIIHNLYNLPIVVCDVSEKNANVMFELGMRLAFDRPTIIIKDDKTNFSFDTGVIEHLEYPRDLRFSKIVEFKRRLSEKVLATFQKSKADPTYSTFLQHFGQFKIASISETEISGQEFIVDQLMSLQKSVERISRNQSPDGRPLNFPAGNEIDLCCSNLRKSEVEELRLRLAEDPDVKGVRVVDVGEHFHLFAGSSFDSVDDRRQMERKYYEVAREIRERRLGSIRPGAKSTKHIN